MLAERLKHLEERGFVYRNDESTIPPAVTYGLTKRTSELDPVLKQMAQLGQKWYEEDLRSGRVPLARSEQTVPASAPKA
ncbi:MAG TPA: winged helix-turn-helix transcriptional regulator [Candidatus Eisenbacteria bacterium]|nr:winged helix-turn-helix transcriptional regulator [Candidatus Eisenbacteria bacterium]